MDSTRGPPRVKNKAAAPVQISAEQLLREAVDRQEVSLQAPTQRFSDLEELHEYQGRKRKEFEDYVRRNRISLHNWTQYAQWELEQKEFARARSVFERALDVIPHSVQLWIRYIEAEMKSRNVNHARNLLDRAVTILPRVDKLWYKYVYMEEMLGNVPGTRQVFDRWMQWQPDEAAWAAYIKMEKRYGEYDRAREIFRVLTMVHPEPRNWIKWAKFEEEFGTSYMVREVFGAAIETLGYDFVNEKLFIAYARFEAKLRECERARAIYKLSLERLPTSKATILQKAYTTFEKQFGDRDGVEDVVLLKRRRHYEQQVAEDPLDYNNWLDYVGLEETSGSLRRTREVYERAVGHTPSLQDKGQWRRYIYLWLFYAIWEEQEANDILRAREVYTRCLALIPHRKFTFAKVWLLAAHFEVRQGELTAARKLMGHAIGMCPKDKLFNSYIDLERKLFEFVRCRTLHQKHLEYNASNCQTWIKFAELERGLDDLDRTRAIFELAVSQPQIDMPELLWKAYIDFEEEEGEYARTRALYERLLARTNHVKVWISYAHFEINIPEDDEEDDEEDAEAAPVSAEAKARARDVFERAHRSLRKNDRKEERVSLLNAWLSFERTHGAADDVAAVERQMPRRVTRRRGVEPDDTYGADADTESWEEYVDYVFPADDAQAKNLANVLALAQKWKETTGGGDVAGALGMVGRGGEDEDGDDDDGGVDGDGDGVDGDHGGDGGDGDHGGDNGGDGSGSGSQKDGEAV